MTQDERLLYLINVFKSESKNYKDLEIPDDRRDREILLRSLMNVRIPTHLIPKNPDDGSKLTTNLRVDESFVEDEGWHKTSEHYYKFLENVKALMCFTLN